MPAISIYGGRGNRCLDFLTGNSFGIYKLWVAALTWRDHSRLSGEEGASHVTEWRPVPFGCLRTLSPKGTGSRVIRNKCRDVGQLHVLLKQINTYLLLPVGTRRHLSVPLNIHEHPGYIGREASWHFFFFYILTDCIKSVWPDWEFNSDSAILHPSVSKVEWGPPWCPRLCRMRSIFVISASQHVELALPSCGSHPHSKSTAISPLMCFYDAGESFRRCTAALFNDQSLGVGTWWIAAAVLICIVKCGPLCLIGYWGEGGKKKKRKETQETRAGVLYWSILSRCLLTGDIGGRTSSDK